MLVFWVIYLILHFLYCLNIDYNNYTFMKSMSCKNLPMRNFRKQSIKLMPIKKSFFHLIIMGSSSQFSIRDIETNLLHWLGFYINIAYLIFNHSFLCQIWFVPSQSNHNVWTSLPLELFDPVFRSTKCVLK